MFYASNELSIFLTLLPQQTSQFVQLFEEWVTQ